MEQRFDRTELLLGEEKISQLKKAHVVVVGLGGVGGYALEAITRMGVGKITIVDGDDVAESNINRQICALSSTVGKSKVEVFAERIKDINPDCEIVAHHVFVEENNLNLIDITKVDLIIDAIDSFSSKVSLIEYADKKQIPIISSMGAALRQDPSKIRAAKLSKTSVCPLARKLRKELIARGNNLKTLCVFSEELVIDANKKLGVREAVPPDAYHARRPLGSMAIIPAMMGLMVASEGIKILLKEKKDE